MAVQAKTTCSVPPLSKLKQIKNMLAAIALAPWMVPAAIYAAIDVYLEKKRSPTFEDVITYYLGGGHIDDIHKELVPIKQKQLQKFVKKNATKNRIYVPPEIVKLISNFSALNLRNEKKLNKLRLIVMSRKLNVMLSLIRSENNRLKKNKCNKYKPLEVNLALLCRSQGTISKDLRRIRFDAEVNLLMLYYYGIFKRLFSLKKDSKKEVNFFSVHHKDPLARMNVLENRRKRLNISEASYLFKNSYNRLVVVPQKMNSLDGIIYNKKLFEYDQLFYLDQLFNYAIFD